MKNKRNFKQGEIYMVNLSHDSIEHEQSKTRPCLIASCSIRNENSMNLFIFPITHSNKKYQPCHYKLYKKDYDFFVYDENTVLCEEGRSVSKNRLEKRIGEISDFDLNKILECKEYVFKERTKNGSNS